MFYKITEDDLLYQHGVQRDRLRKHLSGAVRKFFRKEPLEESDGGFSCFGVILTPCKMIRPRIGGECEVAGWQLTSVEEAPAKNGHVFTDVDVVDHGKFSAQAVADAFLKMVFARKLSVYTEKACESELAEELANF